MLHAFTVRSPPVSEEMKVSNLLLSIRRFDQDQDGATAVEYAIMLALIVAVCILAIGSVGSEASSLWTRNGSEISDAFGN